MFPLRWLWVGVAAWGLSPAARADDLPPGDPTAAGFAPERLRAVEAMLKDAVARKQIAGGAALVARHGKVVYRAAAGMRDAEAGEPFRDDTIVRIASMTKPVTSVAAMMLVEDGKLGLDDPVAKYLPEFKDMTVLVPGGAAGGRPYRLVPADRPVTVLHLLTHTSGLSYRLFDRPHLGKLYAEAGVSDGLAETAGTVGDNVGRLAKLPLLHQPGTAWEYGLSTDVLGRVVEVASGKTLDEFFRDRIFGPLRMHDTHFVVPKEKRPRLAALYTPGRDKTARRVGAGPVELGPALCSATYSTADESRYHSGGAGLASTAGDYARFVQMLLGGGELDGKRLLKRETVDRMTRHQIGDLCNAFAVHGDGFGYGFGVETARDRGKSPAAAGSYSWGGIFGTYFWVDPKTGLVGVLVTQLCPSDHLTLREDFRRLTYAALDGPGGDDATGRFLRLHWFEHGKEHGNPNSDHNRRFRVNAPEVVLHPTHGGRPEARSSGLMQILAGEDPRLLAGAELYLEVWGGHPGTADKRVTVNGRTTYPLPKTGAEDKHCTHLYPTIPLKITDLVNGYNALQFACDQGTTFWGHFIVDNACLRASLKDDHPDLKKAGLAGFKASVKAAPSAGGDEAIELTLSAPEGRLAAVASVDFQGYYHGYDENGDGLTTDWHGFTKHRQPVAFVGTAAKAPFSAAWDLAMLPAQKDVAVRAVVRFKDHPDLVYVTPATRGLRVPERPKARVETYLSKDLPQPFWSRADRKKTCTVELDVDPAGVERAELHVVTWDGGAGTVKEYFTLNGHPLPVAGAGKHDVMYSRLAVDPKLLKKGANRIELRSDTEHHGIEVLRPGPALVVRGRR